MVYDIYIYENLINGKVYIGQTINLRERDRHHSNRYPSSRTVPIDMAIHKYGRSNFSLNVITIVDTKEQADYTEIDWIARSRHLLGKENVYNIGDGGEINSFAGKKHTPETRAIMSINSMGKNKGHPRYNDGHIVPHTEKGKSNIRAAIANITKGKTWKLIDGKRVWMEKN